MPVGSWAFLRQLLGWILLAVSSMVFVYIVLWRPLMDGISIPPEAILVPFLIGYVQNARYISIWRSDESAVARYLTVLPDPEALRREINAAQRAFRGRQ